MEAKRAKCIFPVSELLFEDRRSELDKLAEMEFERLGAMDMGPVHIGTDAEVGKRSWGSLYGAEY